MSVENKKLAEDYGIKAAFEPVDLNAAAITGARIGLAQGYKVAVIVGFGDSVGATVQITLRQHTAASAGTSADLSVANVYYKKVGAATSFTKVEPSVAAAQYDLSADLAAEPGLVVLEIDGPQLSEGFTHFSIDLADSGAAKIVCATYIMSAKHEPAYSLSL
jgi:hypothetical protein